MPGFQVNISTNPKYAHITLQTVTWVFTQLPCSAVQCLQCLRIIVIIKAGFEPGVRPITSPMSHYISNESPHLQCASTSPKNQHISNESPHLKRTSLSPMIHNLSHCRSCDQLKAMGVLQSGFYFLGKWSLPTINGKLILKNLANQFYIILCTIGELANIVGYR